MHQIVEKGERDFIAGFNEPGHEWAAVEQRVTKNEAEKLRPRPLDLFDDGVVGVVYERFKVLISHARCHGRL